MIVVFKKNIEEKIQDAVYEAVRDRKQIDNIFINNKEAIQLYELINPSRPTENGGFDSEPIPIDDFMDFFNYGKKYYEYCYKGCKIKLNLKEHDTDES